MIAFQCSLQAPLKVFVKSLSLLTLYHTYSVYILTWHCGDMRLNEGFPTSFTFNRIVSALSFFSWSFQEKGTAEGFCTFSIFICSLHVRSYMSKKGSPTLLIFIHLFLGMILQRTRATQGFSTMFILTRPLFIVSSFIL